MKKKCVLLGSGGLDTQMSMVLLREKYDIIPIYFDYGQKTALKEIPAITEYSRHLINKEPIILKLNDYQKLLGEIWALTGNVAETLPDKEKIFIPGRNIVFLLYAAIYGYYHDAETLAISLHKDDSISGDCKPPFVESFMKSLSLGMSTPKFPKEYNILMPLKDLHKWEAIKLVSDSEVDFSMSWSCDDSKEFQCGVCRQCVERKDMFKKANYTDPTKYLK